MKNILFIICSFFLLFNLHGQSSHKFSFPLSFPIKTVITGSIKDNFTDFWGILPKSTEKVSIQIVKCDTITVNSNYLNSDTCITTNGNFRFEFYIDRPLYVKLDCIYEVLFNVLGTMSAKNFTNGILIEPGDSINVDATNSRWFENIHFSGKGAEKIWCIQEIIKNSRLYTAPEFNLSNLKLMDSITKMVLNTIKIFEHRLSTVSKTIIKAQYISMLSGDISEVILGQKTKKSPGENTSDESIKILFESKISESKKIIDYNDDALIYSSPYFFDQIVKKRALVQYLISTNNEIPKSGFSKVKYDIYKLYIPDGKLKERILADYIDKSFNFSGLSDALIQCMNDYLSNSDRNSPFHRGLISKYSFIKDRLSKGAQTYNFSLPDTTGKIYSLSDFKGKIVLLDFMFTGCTGCKQMVPFLEKIEKKFMDSSVAFISVSIDKKPSDYLKMPHSKFFVPGSIYLYTDGKGEDHPIVDYYKIFAYPTLILIDRRGKMVGIAPDPRPDNGNELTKFIDDALSEN